MGFSRKSQYRGSEDMFISFWFLPTDFSNFYLRSVRFQPLIFLSPEKNFVYVRRDGYNKATNNLPRNVYSIYAYEIRINIFQVLSIQIILYRKTVSNLFVILILGPLDVSSSGQQPTTSQSMLIQFIIIKSG